MSTWNDTTEYPATGLLPVGKHTMRVLAASTDTNQHTSRLEGVLELEAPNGQAGVVSIPLEPWSMDAEKVEQFERIFKTFAAGLEFEPTNGQRPIIDIAFCDFEPHLHSLVGRSVVARVEHVDSKTRRDDGTAFVNHRVRFLGLADHLDPRGIDTSDFVPLASVASGDEQPF
jgi:hypothetical protein